jgi:hypothetical protein
MQTLIVSLPWCLVQAISPSRRPFVKADGGGPTLLDGSPPHSDLDPDGAERLRQTGVVIRDDPIARLEAEGGKLTRVVVADGSSGVATTDKKAVVLAAAAGSRAAYRINAGLASGLLSAANRSEASA